MPVSAGTAKRLEELGYKQEAYCGSYYAVTAAMLGIPLLIKSVEELEWVREHPNETILLPTLEQIMAEINGQGWVYGLEGRYPDGLCGCECWLPDPEDEHGVIARIRATDTDQAEAAAQCLVRIGPRIPCRSNA